MPSAPGRGAAGAGGGEPSKEFNLEPRHLTLLLLLVIGLCAASFLLGRWVERRAIGPVVPGPDADRSAGTIEEAGDVSDDLTFFDTLKGGAPAPLVPREESGVAAASPAPLRPAVREPASVPNPAGSRSADSRRSVSEGVMIQVMASKDRAAAESLRKRLRAKGYTALLVREGGSYKVRVGPYADRTEAERAGAILRDQEKVQVWIP